MTNPRDFRARFESAVTGPDDAIDLLEAALCIAGAHSRALDLDACRQQFVRMAEAARFRLRTVEGAAAIAEALCAYIRDEQGFRGNHGDYYDPGNSFLDQVLVRRRGIPITLALVYLHIGRALGLKIEGVGFPGHFLVKLIREYVVIIDPFNAQVISEVECAAMLRRAGRPEANLEFCLRAVGNRQILGRMLNNLKMIYTHGGELAEALSCTEWRLILDPESPRDVFDKATLLEQLEQPDGAIEYYENFLRLAPTSKVGESVRAKIKLLRNAAGPSLH